MPAPTRLDDEAPEYDYPHLPGEELDPLMESSLHARWVAFLIRTAESALAHTDALVTGNTPFVPSGTKYHTAPDLIVLPGMRGRNLGRYVVDDHGVAPTVAVEVVSPSNSWPRLERRYRRWLEAGVPEVYQVHPERQTCHRVELRDDEIVRTDALGRYSPGMNLTFVLVGDQLGLCCVGGRAVTPVDDPYAWVAEEQQRADAAEERAGIAEERAGIAEERADTAERRARELAAELDRLRGASG